jgi:hypothetical protein
MEPEEARLVEAVLIDAYPGLSNIMGGEGSNDYGPMHASQLRTKYKAEELVGVLDKDKNYLLISINSSISDMQIYDATRYAWRLDIARAEKAHYVLAESRGILRAVSKATSWHNANNEVFKGFPNHGNEGMEKRYGFVGKQIKNTGYEGKRTPARSKGAANPIRYIYHDDILQQSKGNDL